jgi:uncharacterized protein (TIGR00255 family)
MKSMTGYGCGEAAAEKFQLGLEIKSYNNRYLDIYVNTPLALSPLEPRVRDYLAKKILRGKVEVSVKLKDTEDEADISVDPVFVAGCMAALRRVADIAGTGEAPRLRDLLGMDGILRADKKRDMEDYWRELAPLLEKVLADFEASRVREGEATEKDVLRLLDRVGKNAEDVAACVPELESYFTKCIRGRMEELLADKVDEARIAAEVALLLVKYSIHEELQRLASHREAFLAAAAEPGAVGKKLDFICQEMNREINTIGSKNVLAGISRRVVDMKDCLENIREQVRNIE